MKTKITITEALAELRTIDKRITKKLEFITSHLSRFEALKDPLEKDGGSLAMIARERQAVTDLEERKVSIRRAIAKANAENTIKLDADNGTERSIADWLVWRRDVAPNRETLIRRMGTGIQQARNEAQKRGTNVIGPGATGDARPQDIIVNVNEAELAKEAEQIQETLGSLDGQLSLKNATILIEV